MRVPFLEFLEVYQHHHPIPVVSIDVSIERNTSRISDVPILADHKLDS